MTLFFIDSNVPDFHITPEKLTANEDGSNSKFNISPSLITNDISELSIAVNFCFSPLEIFIIGDTDVYHNLLGAEYVAFRDSNHSDSDPIKPLPIGTHLR